MRINHNIASLNTYRQLSTNSASGAKSLEKLSSGLRINKAGDDAAGLAISEKMRAQIKGLDQASRNAQDGISLIQTAEGALNETQSILQRMRELADQSSNGTNTDDDRKAIQSEVAQLKSEVDRIGNTTEFNTQKLLNGNLKSAAGTSVGQNSTVGAAIAKLAPGNVTGTTDMSTGAIAAADYKAEDITIDGTTVTVDWQNLSTEEQNTINAGFGAAATATQKNAATDLIVKTINSAIDQSGTNVAHVTGWVDSSDMLVIQSGTKGTDSQVIAGGAGGVLDTALGTTGTSTTGTSTYNGSTILADSAFTANINGVQMKIAITADITSGTTEMSSVATELQARINSAIETYNTSAGATQSGDPGYIEAVKVNATLDGHLEVLSESGPISFTDTSGNTFTTDLGLSSAQTNGSSGGGMSFQIGANKSQTVNFSVSDMRSAALGIAGVDVSTQSGAQDAISTLDKALKSVSSERANLGAVQNRLEHTINNLGTSSENLTAAESRIRDVDMAKEMMEFTKNNILSQAAQSMLAQANQQPQGVLQLLR